MKLSATGPTLGPAGWTRRHFLRVSFTTGGALLVSACSGDGGGSAAGGTSTPATDGSTPAGASSPDSFVVSGEPPFTPNLFVSIDVDGTVTLTVHRSEVGQGVRTALAMILADELDADWTKIKIEQAPANSALGSQTTSGSGSITENYTPLRRAAAAARSTLVAAAATHWGIDPKSCGASLGSVINTITNERLGFGELVAAAGGLGPPQQVVLKDPATFRLIGTAVPRVDGLGIVTGGAEYGLDRRIDGMLYAVVARCPVPGGTVASFDATKAKSVAGVQSVIEVPSGVAVIADSTWAAISGRQRLDVTWAEGDNAKWSTDTIDAALNEIIDARVAAAGPAAQGSSVEARYETPFAAHAAMEPVNCIADVRADSCLIIAPTQNPQEVQSFVADRIGVPTEVQVTLIGGGFGRRLEVDFAIEAAEVSRAAGAPVQVVWTREDDFALDFCRQPTKHWLRAEWDASGTVTSWNHCLAAPGLNGIAYVAGADVLDEGLAIPYSIEHRTNQPMLAQITLPTGPWRGVMAGPNAFANECFFDEVAAQLGRDPYELRKQLLPDGDLMHAVLDLAATSAGWGSGLPTGHGRGIACHQYHDVPVAMVADVAVSGRAVRVERVVCAIDCGLVIHPDMVAQQMEGAVVFALTSMLKSQITYRKGRVQQRNFGDHPLLAIDEMPAVEVHIVPSTRDPQGTGEMGVPPTVPAVANAIFAATGARIRRLPVQPGDLRP
ncbi:MAG: isoquinoline 1-oxidoreductase subunit beta [Ilumatobacteraceae bacterium]|nr:isoquinoline 1-oxidoreductase subunit beta [Ilumatobacteraceae bacterium]